MVSSSGRVLLGLLLVLAGVWLVPALTGYGPLTVLQPLTVESTSSASFGYFAGVPVYNPSADQWQVDVYLTTTGGSDVVYLRDDVKKVSTDRLTFDVRVIDQNVVYESSTTHPLYKFFHETYRGSYSAGYLLQSYDVGNAVRSILRANGFYSVEPQLEDYVVLADCSVESFFGTGFAPKVYCTIDVYGYYKRPSNLYCDFSYKDVQAEIGVTVRSASGKVAEGTVLSSFGSSADLVSGGTRVGFIRFVGIEGTSVDYVSLYKERLGAECMYRDATEGRVRFPVSKSAYNSYEQSRVSFDSALSALRSASDHVSLSSSLGVPSNYIVKWSGHYLFIVPGVLPFALPVQVGSPQELVQVYNNVLSYAKTADQYYHSLVSSVRDFPYNYQDVGSKMLVWLPVSDPVAVYHLQLFMSGDFAGVDYIRPEPEIVSVDTEFSEAGGSVTVGLVNRGDDGSAEVRFTSPVGMASRSVFFRSGESKTVVLHVPYTGPDLTSEQEYTGTVEVRASNPLEPYVVSKTVQFTVYPDVRCPFDAPYCVDDHTVGRCVSRYEPPVLEECGPGEVCRDGKCVSTEVPGTEKYCVAPYSREYVVEFPDGGEEVYTCPEGTLCVDGECRDVGVARKCVSAREYIEVLPDGTERGPYTCPAGTVCKEGRCVESTTFEVVRLPYKVKERVSYWQNLSRALLLVGLALVLMG